jgi:hypothetical protein
MICKNCLHAAELHDENEGFCNAKIYHREALENVSVPETCDCYAYEPDGGSAQVGRPDVRKRRISALEALLAIENRLLEEQGRRSSKRSRKLAERLNRVIQGSEEEENPNIDENRPELYSEDISEVDEAKSTSSMSVTDSRRAGEKVPEPTYQELTARVAELEEQVIQRRFEKLEFRIGAKGGVSVYRLGRFPVTLYYEQWVRLLEASGRLRTFLEDNKTAGKLKLKSE